MAEGSNFWSGEPSLKGNNTKKETAAKTVLRREDSISSAGTKKNLKKSLNRILTGNFLEWREKRGFL